MKASRRSKAKLNIGFSLANQIVVLICGLIVPRLLISAYSSEVYGATVSIAQFLAYVTLLEGGIGGVARAALYKPLAENDADTLSKILVEMQTFFRIIAVVFLGYVALLAVFFKQLSHISCMSTFETALLVLVISISIFAQYFFGISYSVLLQAAQETYITQIIAICTTILNTGLIMLLISFQCNIVVVKLVSSCVFVLRPICMQVYVRRRYRLNLVKREKTNYLSQKWTGLGQHLAFFLHSNTDVAVLTILSNLSTVAIYAVHNMVVANLQNVTVSFISGMEAVFGDMYAKTELEKLHCTFDLYESLISIVACILYSVAFVLISPFVMIYTMNINDADYYQPVFALFLLMASLLYCLRTPYHSMTIAAGHFKETKVAAYGEAIINISLSIILVVKFGLVGVAVGTLVATSFRLLYYVYYLANNILHRKVHKFIIRMCVNSIVVILNVCIGQYIINCINIVSFNDWIVSGIIITPITIVITISLNLIIYRNNTMSALKKLK